MDDNAVRAIEEQLERSAVTDRAALANAEHQVLVLQALNSLGASLRDLMIERAFSTRENDPDVREFGIDQRLELLKLRFTKVANYLEPESQRWFEGSLTIPSEESGPTKRAKSGPPFGDRPNPAAPGGNVSRLLPLQVRISEPQAAALERAKGQSGRNVSQLLRDALALKRIQARRQWRRTDSEGQLTIKRWVRCDSATVHALQLVASRENLTVSSVVRELLGEALGV